MRQFNILHNRRLLANSLKIFYISLFLINSFFPQPVLPIVLAVVSLALFGLTFFETRSSTRYMALLLIAVGLYFMWTYQVPWSGWIKASAFNAPLISLLLTVPLLSSILYFEPYQQNLSELAVKYVLSPFRFYVVVSTLLTLLASLINLASFHFVHQLFRPLAEKFPVKLFSSALIRGFLPNTLWSPSYISVAFIAQYVNLSWLALAPLGISLAAAGVPLLLGLGWLEYGRASTPCSITVPESSNVSETTRISLWKLSFQTAVLIFLIVALEQVTKKSAMVIVPLVSLIGPMMLALAYGRSEAYIAQTRDYLQHRLPLITNEIVLFTAIGFFGYALGISEIPRYIPLLINQLGLDTPLLLLPILVLAIGLFSTIGIHPMITIAALATSLPPGSVPLSTLQIAGAYLTGYMLYSVLSPFSAATLLLGGLTRQSPVTVGPKDNGGFAFLYVALCIGIILICF